MKPKEYLVLFALAALWGASFLFIKVAVQDMSPLTRRAWPAARRTLQTGDHERLANSLVGLHSRCHIQRCYSLSRDQLGRAAYHIRYGSHSERDYPTDCRHRLKLVAGRRTVHVDPGRRGLDWFPGR